MRLFPAVLAALVAEGSFSFAQTARPSHPSSSQSKHRMPARTGPDLILFDGLIYTGLGFADDKPEVVQAIAIGGGKVLAAGKTSEILALAGPNTHLHDLNSATTGTIVFPGFNDAHTHLGEAGQTKLNLDLA